MYEINMLLSDKYFTKSPKVRNKLVLTLRIRKGGFPTTVERLNRKSVDS